MNDTKLFQYIYDLTSALVNACLSFRAVKRVSTRRTPRIIRLYVLSAFHSEAFEQDFSLVSIWSLMMHTQGLQASFILLTIKYVVCQIVFQNNGHAPPISPDISSVVTNTSIGSSLACETPIGKQGECVNIRKCPSLISSARRGDIQYLKRSVCGRQGKVTHLCCPDHVTNHPIKPVEPVPAAPPQFQSASDCGISPLQPGRIIGGQPVEFIGMFPWAAALYYDDNRNPVKCGGAIISDRWVITAAHCILDIGPKFARLGDLNLISEIDDLFQHPPQHIGIMRVVKHEQYEHRLSDPKGMMNDIALLKLEESIKFSDVVRPICLPNKVTPLLELERRQGVIAGWGATEFGGQGSSVMLWARVNISDQDQCRNSYGSAAVTVHRERQMCANGNDPTVDRPDCGPGDAFELRCQGGVDTCAGDSGGPLIIDRQHLNRDRWYCEGIVSFGVGCGNGYFPGIYTKVDEYLPWISRHIHV